MDWVPCHICCLLPVLQKSSPILACSYFYFYLISFSFSQVCSGSPISWDVFLFKGSVSGCEQSFDITVLLWFQLVHSDVKLASLGTVSVILVFWRFPIHGLSLVVPRLFLNFQTIFSSSFPRPISKSYIQKNYLNWFMWCLNLEFVVVQECLQETSPTCINLQFSFVHV